MTMTMIVEQAQKDRISRTHFNSVPRKIKAGERCLVLKNQHGWTTNVRKPDAQKMLLECLKQLGTQPTTKEPTMESKQTDVATTAKFKVLNPMSLLPTIESRSFTVGPKLQIGIATVMLAAIWFGGKKLLKSTGGYFNESTDQDRQEVKNNDQLKSKSI